MAKRKKKPEGQPLPAPALDSRSRDRHKPGSRRSVALPPQVYRQLQALAEQNNRPLNWELRLIVVRALTEVGLWPPPPQQQGEE